jgi:hypothetical protein
LDIDKNNPNSPSLGKLKVELKLKKDKSSSSEEKKKEKVGFLFGATGKAKTPTIGKQKLSSDLDIQVPVLDVDNKKIQILHHLKN